MTEDIRLRNGTLRELVPVPVGECLFGAGWSRRVFTLESCRAWLEAVGP